MAVNVELAGRNVDRLREAALLVDTRGEAVRRGGLGGTQSGGAGADDGDVENLRHLVDPQMPQIPQMWGGVK